MSSTSPSSSSTSPSFTFTWRTYVLPILLSTVVYISIAFHVNSYIFPYPLSDVRNRDVEASSTVFEGPYSINTYLRDNIEHLVNNKVHNPETIFIQPNTNHIFIFDRLGYLYRIHIHNPFIVNSNHNRINDDSSVEVIGYIGGRVLGAMFLNQNTIIACDVAKGLLQIKLQYDKDNNQQQQYTIDTIEILSIGTDVPYISPIHYIDDLDITQDGTTIYFSDAADTHPYMKPISLSTLQTKINKQTTSTKWYPNETFVQELYNSGTTYWTTKELSLIDFYRGYGTGKLLKYNFLTKKTEILISNLYFANGVALSKDESFVLVAETFNMRIIRYWLKGDRAGSKEIFAELPCVPDGISRAYDGGFYVACPSIISPLFSIASQFSFVRWFVGSLPSFLWPPTPNDGVILKLHSNGAPAYALHDVGGKHVHFITAVTEVPDPSFVQQQQTEEREGKSTNRKPTEGWLYFGQLQGSSIPRVRIPQNVNF